MILNMDQEYEFNRFISLINMLIYYIFFLVVEYFTINKIYVDLELCVFINIDNDYHCQ